MPVQNVNLSPYTTELADAERRRKLLEALQAQSIQPIEQQPTPPGGYAVPIAPTQGLAKIAQALAAAYGQHKIGEESKALGERYGKERSGVVANALRMMEGTPASSEMIMDEQANGGEGAMASINAPAIPGNRRKAYEALASNERFPDLQNMGLAELLKKPEQKIVPHDSTVINENNEVQFRAPSVPQRPLADNRPEVMKLGATPKQIQERISQLTTRPEKTESVSPIGRMMAERNALPPNSPDMVGYNQAIGAVGRPPQTHVSVTPAVTVTQITDPNNPQQMISVDARTYKGGSIGSPGVLGVSGKLGDAAKLENKRAFNMQGIGATIQQAEDILNGVERDASDVTKPVSTPTGSLIGRGIDIGLGAVGAATPGAVQAQRLRAVGGALVSKMPRMEGPQSDKDVALYKEMAGQVGDATQPIATRKAALDTVKQLWSKYERLNPDSFNERRAPVESAMPQRRAADRLSPAEQLEREQLRKMLGR